MRILGLKSIAASLLSAFLLFSPAFPASAQTTPPSTIQAFHLVSPTAGWLLADGRLFWTTSTGSQWSEITPPASANTHIVGADLRSNGHGIAVQASPDGSTVSIARTTDSGAHWASTTLESPFSAGNPFGGHAYPTFADDQHGWLLLTLQSSSVFRLGLLFRTTNGGVTWTQLPTPPIGADLTFTDATHGFIGPGPAGDELYATSDAGQTWHTASLPSPTALSSTPSTITLPTFVDAEHGTLIRTYSTDATPTQVLYQTTDAGLTWTAASIQRTSNLIAIAANGAITAPLSITRPQADLSLSTPLIASRSSFATATNGWALFEAGNCDASQGACTQTSQLMGTLDGGNTFFALGQPSGITLQSTHSFTIPKSHTTATPFLSPSGPQPDSSVSVQGAMGFDACTLPTTAQMQTWYTSSPYRVIGAYIGGNEFACKSGLTNFTAAWTSTILGMGFEIMPIWVGPQAPGNGSKFSFLMSTDTTTAFNQGVTEADSAIAAMTDRGMGQGSSIIYDIEAYPYTVAANVAGTQAFLEGWNTELHAKGYIAGVYSSHPEFDQWTPPMLSPAIDIISFAYFFNSGVACGANCQTVFPTQSSSFDLPANYWLNHHRNRQTS
ncbi:MAG: glycoside hydrolase domain-containing protein, partial [Acidobacteriota bacterium]